MQKIEDLLDKYSQSTVGDAWCHTGAAKFLGQKHLEPMIHQVSREITCDKARNVHTMIADTSFCTSPVEVEVSAAHSPLEAL